MYLSPARASAIAAVLALAFGGALTLPRVRDGLPPVGADAPAYCRIARTFVTTGSLELPGPSLLDRDPQQDLSSVFGTPYALSRDGRLLPKHSVLYGLYLVPGTALAGTRGAQASALLLASALAAFLTRRAAEAFGGVAALLSFACFFLLVPGGRSLAFGVNLDTALAFVVLLAFDLAARGRGLSSGIVGASALFLRPTTAFLVLPLPFVARARGPAPLVRTILGLGAGAFAYAATNVYFWGGPFTTAYARAAVFGPDGLRIVDHSGAFGSNPFPGAARILASYPHGLVFVFPLLILSLSGFLLRGARRPEWWVPAVVGLAGFLVLSTYDYAVAHPEHMIYRFAGLAWFASAPSFAALLAWIGTRWTQRRTGPAGLREPV